jgi:hypothetical protein
MGTSALAEAEEIERRAARAWWKMPLVTDGPALLREWYARKGLAESPELARIVDIAQTSGFKDKDAPTTPELKLAPSDQT